MSGQEEIEQATDRWPPEAIERIAQWLHDREPTPQDFDDPDVRERLEAHGCKFFGKFEDGLRYIVARIGAS
jgi:hypothetical protein